MPSNPLALLLGSALVKKVGDVIPFRRQSIEPGMGTEGATTYRGGGGTPGEVTPLRGTNFTRPDDLRFAAGMSPEAKAMVARVQAHVDKMPTDELYDWLGSNTEKWFSREQLWPSVQKWRADGQSDEDIKYHIIKSIQRGSFNY